jgi:predicted porin
MQFQPTLAKLLIAGAVAGAFAAPAMAQTSVNVEGIVDMYVGSMKNPGDNGRTTAVNSGGMTTSFLGFKGVEDLGGGLNARFNLETGFNTGTGAVESTTGSFGSTTPSTGTGTGAFWQRTATVGLGGAWGGIDIGQQYSVSFKTIGLYDPFNYKYTGIIPVSGIAAGSGVSNTLGGTRFHNDVQYTGTFGPITARAEYSFGEVAGATSTNRAWAAGASYANGPLAVGAAYTNKKVGSTGGLVAGPVATATAAGAAAATAASPTFDDKAWTLGAAYKFGPARVAVGYNNERLSGAVGTTTAAGQVLTPSFGGAETRVRVGWAGVGFDISPAVNVTGAWYQSRFDTPSATAVTTGKENLFIIGATYAFSKRTNAYADIDWKKLDGNRVLTSTTTTATQDRVTGVSVGINHLF